MSEVEKVLCWGCRRFRAEKLAIYRPDVDGASFGLCKRCRDAIARDALAELVRNNKK